MDLTISHASAGFNQQGQFDWVALGNSTVSASVAVFARLTAAKIDPQTVSIGHALSSNFKLSTSGKRLIQQTLGNLKWCSSLGDVLWFGFGVEHPLRYLARTENGYTCVALYGALSTINNDHEAAAFIMTELTAISSAPQYLRPSLQQWHDMLRCCSGVLLSTNFECIADQYMHLCDKYLPFVGEPVDIALAMDAIGKLSKGMITSITLVGGRTCGWLAAFAHFFFGLDVELQDGDQGVLLRTLAEVRPVHIRVIFNGEESKDIQVSETTYIIRDVVTQTTHELRTGRVPWDQALKRAFGHRGKALLQARMNFGRMIGSAARVFTAVAQSDKSLIELLGDGITDQIYRNWTEYSFASYGRNFVNFALNTFEKRSELRDAMKSYSEVPLSTAISEYKSASIRISQICTCISCNQTIEDRKLEGWECLHNLAECIIGLIWHLSLSTFSQPLQPLYQGLKEFNKSWHNKHSSKQLGNITQLLWQLDAVSTYETALSVFGGDNRKFNPEDIPAAVVSNGLCFFVDTLQKISDRPDSCIMVHIIPGTIQGQSGGHYEILHDTKIQDELEKYTEEESHPLDDLASLHSINETHMEVDLVATEGLRRLSASLKISSERGTAHVGPMYLKMALLKSVGLIECKGQDCAPLKASRSSIRTVKGEGIVTPEQEKSRCVVVRRLTGSVVGRCLSVCDMMYNDERYSTGSERLMNEQDDLVEDFLSVRRNVAYDEEESHPSRRRKRTFSSVVLMRMNECIPCTIRAGLAASGKVVYITI